MQLTINVDQENTSKSYCSKLETVHGIGKMILQDIKISEIIES